MQQKYIVATTDFDLNNLPEYLQYNKLYNTVEEALIAIEDWKQALKELNQSVEIEIKQLIMTVQETIDDNNFTAEIIDCYAENIDD